MNYQEYLKTEQFTLRAVEKKDLDALYVWENSVDIWEVSETIAPFSYDILRKYIENSHLDIYAARQLRLMIDIHTPTKQTIGTVDLYDFNPHHKRAGVGIFLDKEFRGKGYALGVLDCIVSYARDILLLNQLYAEISAYNTTSIHVFTKCGFLICGTRKEWLQTKKGYVDQHILQIIL